jgi:hypothetical protein
MNLSPAIETFQFDTGWVAASPGEELKFLPGVLKRPKGVSTEPSPLVLPFCL